jgi:hypothetical protein
MPRHRRFALVTSSLASLVLIGTLAVAAPSGASAPRTSAMFAAPSSIVSSGPWIVVANRTSSTLTFLAVSNGAMVGHLSHASLGVNAPSSMVAESVGARRMVFIAGAGGKVVEVALAASGASIAVTRVRTFRPKGCALSQGALLALGAHARLVEACADGALTEWRSATGMLVKAVAASVTKTTNVTGLAVLGSSIYLANAATAAAGSAPDGVTEVSADTGKRLLAVTNATNASYAFSSPSGIASDGTHLWEINSKGDTVDELAAGTLHFVASSGTNLTAPGTVLATPTYVWVSSSSVNGSSSMVTQFDVVSNAVQSPWMMCNSNGPYQFGEPTGFALHDGMLWVANSADNLVDEMNATTGALAATYS